MLREMLLVRRVLLSEEGHAISDHFRYPNHRILAMALKLNKQLSLIVILYIIRLRGASVG